MKKSKTKKCGARPPINPSPVKMIGKSTTCEFFAKLLKFVLSNELSVEFQPMKCVKICLFMLINIMLTKKTCITIPISKVFERIFYTFLL